MRVSSRYRRGAVAVVLIVAATAAGAALAPADLKGRLIAAIEGNSVDQVKPSAPANTPQPVRVSAIHFGAPDLSSVYTGTVRPRFESAMGFRVDGKIAARAVDVGSRVDKGQVIAVLDDADLKLALEAAEAEQSAARTDLERAVASVERTHRLRADGHVAQAALDAAESDAAQAQSRVNSAASSVARARNDLAYTILRADAPGVVTAISAEAGQVVKVGQAVATIARTDAVDAEIALPEQKRSELSDGRAVARLWGDEGTAWPVTLREVSPDVDPVSRTYRVRLAFEPGSAPDLGRTVSVTLDTPATLPVAALPLASVHDDGTGPVVWKLAASADRVTRVPVTLATVGADAVLVRGELAEGDLVVSLGAQRIDPDRPVKVVETADAVDF